MSKISDLNYSQHITLADNFKQKSEVFYESFPQLY